MSSFMHFPICATYCTLSDEQAQTYMERFAMPEQFIKVNGAIVVLPYL